MNGNKLAFTLAIITGVLCTATFFIKLFRTGNSELPILLAGIFVVSLGISKYFQKPK